MQPADSKTTLYFDGSCPLCRTEIAHYRRADGAGELCFVDISDKNKTLPADLTRCEAMRRFHVRKQSGTLLSGAAAFAEVWRHLPRWRWAARAAALPGALRLLELAYRLFLPLRPALSRFVGFLQRSRRGVERRIPEAGRAKRASSRHVEAGHASTNRVDLL